MGRAADGKEFGESLNETQYELPEISSRVTLVERDVV